MPKEYTTPTMSTHTYYKIVYDDFSKPSQKCIGINEAKAFLKIETSPCKLFLVTEVLTELDIEKI